MLINNFTIKYPHEINPERSLVSRHCVAVLLYQIALSRDEELSAINGSIITKPKGYDLWSIYKDKKFVVILIFIYPFCNGEVIY